MAGLAVSLPAGKTVSVCALSIGAALGMGAVRSMGAAFSTGVTLRLGPVVMMGKAVTEGALGMRGADEVIWPVGSRTDEFCEYGLTGKRELDGRRSTTWQIGLLSLVRMSGRSLLLCLSSRCSRCMVADACSAN
jgi:hypothetical protein